MKVNEIKIKMDDFLKFLGYFISEGSTSHGKHCGISQKLGWKKDKMHKDLSCLPFHVSSDNHDDKHSALFITSTPLAKWLDDNIGKGSPNKKIPNSFLQLSARQLKILLDALVLDDGTDPKWSVSRNIWYSTCSKILADQIQEIALKIGSCSTILYSDKNIGRLGSFGRGNYRGYSLCLVNRRITPGVNINKKQDAWEEYSGKIYCCTIPNHTMYVRKNGKPVWTGNSMISVMLAIGVYFDFYAKDRKRGTSFIGNLQDIVDLDQKVSINVMGANKNANVCRVCGSIRFDELPDGGKICRRCQAQW